MGSPETELEELPELDPEVPKGCPTPEDIRRECRRIQDGWSPEDFEKRAAGNGRQRWSVPGAEKWGTVWQGRQARTDRCSDW